jgi:hypothetical protein
MSAVSAPLLRGTVDVPARVLDIATQLAPLVLAHAAAIGFSGAACIALRLGPGRIALRTGPRTLGLRKRPKPRVLLERTRSRCVHRHSRNQAPTNSKKSVHTPLPSSTRAADSEMARSIAFIVTADATSRPVTRTIASGPGAGERGQGFIMDERISGTESFAMEQY